MNQFSVLRAMRNSLLKNYIVPGLSSALIGGNGNGSVRLFEASREQHNDITPHGHRFDFACLVLRGSVINRIWTPSRTPRSDDYYAASTLVYGGEPGQYTQMPPTTPAAWSYQDTAFVEGEWYWMTHDQVHSISFSRDAIVLFFEGPTVADKTLILEPWVAGSHIPTFKVEPWMFQKE